MNGKESCFYAVLWPPFLAAEQLNSWRGDGRTKKFLLFAKRCSRVGCSLLPVLSRAGLGGAHQDTRGVQLNGVRDIQFGGPLTR